MAVIDQWLNGYTHFEPNKATVNVTLHCNLTCKHCYHIHLNESSLQEVFLGRDTFLPGSKDWTGVVERFKKDFPTVPLTYAGRVLIPRGVQFIKDYHSRVGRQVSIIDNGYFIMRWIDEIGPMLDQIVISIDGWKDYHDWQREKEGAWDVAWQAVLDLKKLGFDPIVASAIRKPALKNWRRFEDLLEEHDVPLTATHVWEELPVTEERGTVGSSEADEIIEVLEELTRHKSYVGLVNVYSQQQVVAAKSLLSRLSWSPEEDVMSAAMPNGGVLAHRPPTVSAMCEISVDDKGSFGTSSDNLSLIKSIEIAGTDEYLSLIESHRSKELSLWEEITK